MTSKLKLAEITGSCAQIWNGVIISICNKCLRVFDSLHLQSIDLAIALSDIYEDVEL